MFARITTRVSRMPLILLAWIFFHPKRYALAACGIFGEVFIAPMTWACTLMIGRRTAGIRRLLSGRSLLERESAPEIQCLVQGQETDKLAFPKSVDRKALSEPLSQTSESVRIAINPRPLRRGADINLVLDAARPLTRGRLRRFAGDADPGANTGLAPDGRIADGVRQLLLSIQVQGGRFAVVA